MPADIPTNLEPDQILFFTGVARTARHVVETRKGEKRVVQTFGGGLTFASKEIIGRFTNIFNAELNQINGYAMAEAGVKEHAKNLAIWFATNTYTPESSKLPPGGMWALDIIRQRFIFYMGYLEFKATNDNEEWLNMIHNATKQNNETIRRNKVYFDKNDINRERFRALEELRAANPQETYFTENISTLGNVAKMYKQTLDAAYNYYTQNVNSYSKSLIEGLKNIFRHNAAIYGQEGEHVPFYFWEDANGSPKLDYKPNVSIQYVYKDKKREIPIATQISPVVLKEFKDKPPGVGDSVQSVYTLINRLQGIIPSKLSVGDPIVATGSQTFLSGLKGPDIISVEDHASGTNWIIEDLKKGYCAEEGKALKHCGNLDGQNNNLYTIYSVREVKGDEPSDDGYAKFPYLTVTSITKDKSIHAMKGKDNNKPEAAKMGPVLNVLTELLKNPKRATVIVGDRYNPSTDININDFTDEQLKEIFKHNPNLIHRQARLGDDGIDLKNARDLKIEGVHDRTLEKYGDKRQLPHKLKEERYESLIKQPLAEVYYRGPALYRLVLEGKISRY